MSNRTKNQELVVIDTKDIVNAESIFNLRKKLGLSQKKFAKILGTDEATYYRWEHGIRNVGTANSKLLYLLDRNPEILKDLYYEAKEESND